MAEGNKPNFTGKYKHVKVEGFEAYLRADGAGFMARKMAGMMNPEVEMVQDGDKFEVKMVFPMFKKEIAFTVGQEFEETQKNGNVMKVKPFWNGDKLIMQLTPKVEGKGSACTHTRSLNGDEMILEMEIGETKATRWFKRQAHS